MNPIAKELNDRLAGSVAERLLSRFGKEIFFPRGIVAQATEAGAKAKRFDATIGMAVEHKEPMSLGVVLKQVPGLTSREATAYAPPGGVAPVRESWFEQMKLKNPSMNPAYCSLPMVVPGLTNGIFQCGDLFVDPDDAVVIPDLHWDNYELIFETRRSAQVLTFPLFTEAGGFNSAALGELLASERKSKGRKKFLLVLNFPNNPTGYSPNKKEAEEIVAVLKKEADQGSDFLVICDDAYFGLFYEEGTLTESLFSFLSSAHKNILAVKIDGSTKEDFVWGFRLGFLTFGSLGLSQDQLQALIQKLMGAIRSSISNSSSVGQHILRKAYADPDYKSQKEEAFKKLKLRYHKVKEIVRSYEAGTGKKALKALPFNSGYFMSFLCDGFSPETLRVALLEKEVGTIALQDKYLRVAYSSVDLDKLEALYQEIFALAQTYVS